MTTTTLQSQDLTQDLTQDVTLAKPTSKPTSKPVTAWEPVCDDLVGDILARVIALAPAFNAALAAQVEKETRDKWGGDRVYVQRRGGTLSARNAAIRRDFQAGERVPLLMRRYSLSAPRLWHIIKNDPAA
jgi:Mor family transcriptional regulator